MVFLCTPWAVHGSQPGRLDVQLLTKLTVLPDDVSTHITGGAWKPTAPAIYTPARKGNSVPDDVSTHITDCVAGLVPTSKATHGDVLYSGDVSHTP